MTQRAASGTDPSDATPAIAVAMATVAAGWPEATTIDTRGDPAQTLASALQRVRRPGARHSGRWR